MKIYVDTNIFYNDWFMKQANFKYLFYYIANENEDLLISKVVCEEVENIRRRESEQAVLKIKNEIKILSKLLPFDTSYDSRAVEEFRFNFTESLHDRCESLEILEYENISHAAVVSRALTNKKPFSDGEKGYRDTLIWLSLLNHLKEKNYKGEVVFITKNTSDFFEKSASGLALHKDLANDLITNGINAKITPCDSLFSFVRDNIDKQQHVVEHRKMEDILEREGCLYFSDTSGPELTDTLKYTRLANLPLHNLLFSNAEIFEGLEDEYIEKSKEMGNGEVFISFSFNIRSMVLSLEIPKTDFLGHKSEFESAFFEINIKEESVFLETCIRPYFDISFIYNTTTDTYKQVSISCDRIK